MLFIAPGKSWGLHVIIKSREANRNTSKARKRSAFQGAMRKVLTVSHAEIQR